MSELFNDDMFNVLGNLAPQSVDLLLTDFPYGTLNKRNEWDTIIDYPTFWQHVDRVCKPTCPIISTAAQPFTSVLIASNYKDFKYTMVWEKIKGNWLSQCQKATYACS